MNLENLPSAERWNLFAGSMTDLAFLLLDPQGRIVDWSAGAEKLFGHVRGEAIGRHVAMTFLPEDREAGVPEQLLATADREGRATDERWHLRADGQRFRTSAILHAMRDADSRLLGFAKAQRDVTEREQTREETERTLRERTALLREVQHRVKNNLQMIVSLVSLQASRILDPETANLLQETESRVRAIAAVHECLYASKDFSTVRVGPYLENLVYDLRSLFDSSNRIEVDLQTADLALDIHEALPLALLCNELVSNSLRHAFPGGGPGRVTVSLGYESEPAHRGGPARAELRVRDNGAGLPASVDVQTSDTMGFELLRLLGKQLRATVAADSGPAGTSIRVSFPLEP